MSIDRSGPQRLILNRRRAMKLGAAGIAAVAISRTGFAQGKPLSLYSSIAPEAQQRLSDAFTAKTGIAIQTLRLPSGPLGQRLLAEQSSRNFTCDVLSTGAEGVLREATKLNLLAPLAAVDGIDTIQGIWRPAANYFISSSQGYTIGYNTKAASNLAGWKDVARPEFKDKLVLLDPRLDDVTVTFWIAMQRAFGDDFLKAVGALKPKLLGSMIQGGQMLASGEASVLVPAVPAAIVPLMQKGALVAMTPVPSPSLGLANYTALMANAPNPSAGVTYLKFLISREGQEILCKDLYMSPLGEIPGSIKPPAQLLAISDMEAPPVRDRILDLLALPA